MSLKSESSIALELRDLKARNPFSREILGTKQKAD